MRMKDRMTRLEAQTTPPLIDRTRIEEGARIVNERMGRLVGSAAEKGDPTITLEERLRTMSVAEHVAWSLVFLPGFQATMPVIEELMDRHAQARLRFGA